MTTSACAARSTSPSWARMRAAIAAGSRPRCGIRRSSITSRRATTSHTSSTSASHFASTSRRRFDHHRRRASGRAFAAGDARRRRRRESADARWRSGVPAGRRVGEDDRAQPLAIDGAVRRHHAAAERRHHLREPSPGPARRSHDRPGRRR